MLFYGLPVHNILHIVIKMSMVKEQIQFNKKEALRYYRADPEDAVAEAVIDAAYKKLKSELQPRYTVKRFACRALSEKELLQSGQKPASEKTPQNKTDNVPLFVLLDNGTVFRSKALARYVGEAKELLLFGATLGSRVDIALRRMALTSVAEAGAGQAVAAALIETYCDDCCAELQKQLPEGKKLKWRFSPGYGDWALEEQKILFPVLDCAHTIGLTLTESCMMVPVKSVTAVMAIADTPESIGGEETDETTDTKENALGEFNCNQKITEIRNLFSISDNKCLRCSKTDCEFRKK